jgi:hypothetical protein
MNDVIIIAILVICSGTAGAQIPASAPDNDKSQPAKQPPAANTTTSPKKVRVDRQGFEQDQTKSKDKNSPQIGAGTRGLEPTATLYAPSLGLAYTLRPVFYWDPPYGAQKVTFRLMDSEGNEIYAAEVRSHNSLIYPQDAPPLRIGATYRWTIQPQGVQLSEPPEPARLLVLSGPEREEVKQELQKFSGSTMQQRIQQAQVFVDHRLWYDAVATYSQLISDYPNQPNLYQYRGNVYGDLPQTRDLAEQDFAQVEERQ